MRIVFLLLILSCFSLFGETHYQGRILSIQKFSMANQPSPYLQFILETSEGEYTVEAGPQWNLKTQGFILLQGQEIEVEGEFVTIGGRQILIAHCLKQGKLSIRLNKN